MFRRELTMSKHVNSLLLCASLRMTTFLKVKHLYINFIFMCRLSFYIGLFKPTVSKEHGTKFCRGIYLCTWLAQTSKRSLKCTNETDLLQNKHTEFILSYKFNHTRGQREVYVRFGWYMTSAMNNIMRETQMLWQFMQQKIMCLHFICSLEC